MLNTILCATDGSAHANTAVTWAGDLAAKYGAKLVLLYVLSHRELSTELRRMAEIEHLAEGDPAFPAMPPMNPLGSLHKTLTESEVSSAHVYRKIGEQTLGLCKLRLDGLGIADVRTVIEDGDPASKILEVAQREKADLVVMGRRGLGDLKGFLLGSVTHKVAQLSHCPCLTVE
jgi:nucleotide-binding universal stress UspA family protein